MLVLLLPMTSCKSGGNNAPAEAATEAPVDTLPGDFVAFFNRFHDDSVYQMEHILWPLEGLPAAVVDGEDIPSERYYWQKSNWKKHNHFTDPGGNFDQWYEVANDRFIEHWIQLKGTNMYMRRRFAKLDDGWFLIYYQGLRPMEK
jgi:hypothetical protein